MNSELSLPIEFLHINNILTFSLVITTNIFILMYLGTTFSPSDSSVEPQDWKRKWIIFFSWFGLILSILSGLFVFGLLKMGVYETIFALIIICIPIITHILTLIYLGTSLDSSYSIDLQDWKRKWIIFFAWFGLISNSLIILNIFDQYYLLPKRINIQKILTDYRNRIY